MISNQIIINNDINLNDNYKEVVNKILNYTEEYEENELLNITSTKWIQYQFFYLFYSIIYREVMK